MDHEYTYINTHTWSSYVIQLQIVFSVSRLILPHLSHTNVVLQGNVQEQYAEESAVY